MASSEDPQGPTARDRRVVLALTILGTLLLWVYAYNWAVLDMNPVKALFAVADTTSEDIVLGSLVTVVVGAGIVAVFTITKLYTQVISVGPSFRMLEVIAVESWQAGDWRQAARRVLNFTDEPEPEELVPEYPASVLFSFSLLYLMSWIYLVLFSEALFFISWSAGVDLPLTESNLELLPTLALAIPFSARIMAWLRYPYAQDYADFMPGAVFVLLLVGSLGYLFQSDDQKFFLMQVWENPTWLWLFTRNGLLLGFVPVFSEGVVWLYHVSLAEEAEDAEVLERLVTEEASPEDPA